MVCGRGGGSSLLSSGKLLVSITYNGPGGLLVSLMGCCCLEMNDPLIYFSQGLADVRGDVTYYKNIGTVLRGKDPTLCYCDIHSTQGVGNYSRAAEYRCCI